MQDAVRHKGKIQVTYAALKRALRLPENARIIGVVSDPYELEMEEFSVLVEDDSFPVWEPGMRVVRDYADGCLRDRQDRPTLYFGREWRGD